jgi:hypothetical protein
MRARIFSGTILLLRGAGKFRERRGRFDAR